MAALDSKSSLGGGEEEEEEEKLQDEVEGGSKDEAAGAGAPRSLWWHLLTMPGALPAGVLLLGAVGIMVRAAAAEQSTGRRQCVASPARAGRVCWGAAGQKRGGRSA